MRKIKAFNENWYFTKTAPEDLSVLPRETVERVTLPHTWNAHDGQDGGNDYYRGECFYFKALEKGELRDDELWLELGGANSSARVFINGVLELTHHGGYSAFRVNLTDYIKKDSALICVAVDNSPSDKVYPQTADFTFYGGIYRDVKLISLPKCHFDLSYHGSPGIMVTPRLKNGCAIVEVKAFLQDEYKDMSVLFEITDREGNIVATDSAIVEEKSVVSHINIESPHLWRGVCDPYLYSAHATLFDAERTYDKISADFGVRSFEVTPSRGFFLNGEEYALRGVSRHQDRLGLGNALTHREHEEDMALIRELGANTIRLAHYQHDSYFYDLCDREGIVVWAEIPYISNHMSGGFENTVSQMKELIYQCYNHPSICFWGLSNEITMGGYDKEELIYNHRILNDLAHTLDPTRYTTLAALSMCPIDDAYLKIPDLVAYNHYFGWYGGDTSMNGEWFDEFHSKYPLRPIGVSEYGCEGADWHATKFVQGDYTEEYQAYYHEELIKQLFSRKYIWATYVWNMFDFGADARAEAGEPGQNHKGLVTFDRKYKKDAFFAYKAYMSSEPFVHIAGKRYIDRIEPVVKIRVYSNLDTVELFRNGESVGVKSAPDHFFEFEVENEGESELLAVSGDYRDTSLIRRVDTFNEDYILKEKGAVLNWFDISAPEGCLSLNDRIDVIMSTSEGARVVSELFDKVKKALPTTDGAMTEGLLKMMGSFTLLRLTSMMAMMDVKFTKEELLTLNRHLNRIRKP